MSHPPTFRVILPPVCKTTGPIMQLRPRTACTVPEKDNPSKQEQNSYRMLHMGKTCEMFNTAYRQHRLQSPKCTTFLEFDFEAEHQKGVCWKETLKCRYCNFRSGQNNLYEEMQTDSRGPKTAKPNISLWVALMDNPIMGTSLQEIFLAPNCPAPSYTGLQRNGGKVGPRMVEMVKEDLRRERTYLKGTLENCGYPRLTPIPIEGVTAKNKLCRKRTKGSKCPEHPGKCSASLTMDAPIGCEHIATEEICHDILTDREPTLITHMTTDGDSAAFRGVQKAMKEHGQTVEALRDTRHLAQSQKKAVDNAKFSQNMLPERTATERQAKQIFSGPNEEVHS
uniref:Mutator-like transposase domain-containing protein n=1 Tax=Magallana gigas TaxID=29159 RepID=K1QL72_MAGGI